MRWENERRSQNVEDRRGQRSGMRGGQRNAGFPIPLKGKAGLAILVVVLAAGYFGFDLTPILNGQLPLGDAQSSQQTQYVATPEEQEMAEFTSVALAKTEDLWIQRFRENGMQYREPTLVIYSGTTNTACGYGQAAMGPFYCPADEQVYLDLSFYQDMKRNLGGGGDFAQGYVIAHEVGHHVQHLLGITNKMREMQSRVNKTEANKLSVKLELQADCFAGIWGRSIQDQNLLDVNDIGEAMSTAAAIGDDRLQKQSRGTVVPDSFTHGTSKQRQEWFMRGFNTGSIQACDTFSAR
ncbi:MAG TPA: neutral zinc metallopeptidase [Candidatus Ignatzschineria merdigallinarum]|uniref:Neutral zinc metallopeptidase n=1 Tax=Candidatus Ignatzschineria merdigallinarum TaxID=2838621 RepID=A0A9D1TUP8_9GAMM|nr:neutral zinc metallopeptidase [Candidatus Ignatzschineria merdigallinarum]